jgi:hypothetical protein
MKVFAHSAGFTDRTAVHSRHARAPVSRVGDSGARMYPLVSMEQTGVTLLLPALRVRARLVDELKHVQATVLLAPVRKDLAVAYAHGAGRRRPFLGPPRFPLSGHRWCLEPWPEGTGARGGRVGAPDIAPAAGQLQHRCAQLEGRHRQDVHHRGPDPGRVHAPSTPIRTPATLWSVPSARASTRRNTPRTIRNLLRNVDPVDSLTELSRYMHHSGQLHLIAGEQGPEVSDSLTAEEYLRIHRLISSCYSAAPTDCGAG